MGIPSLLSYLILARAMKKKSLPLAWLAAVDESVEEPVAAILKNLTFFLALEVVSSVVR